MSRRRGAPGTIGLLEQLPGVVFDGDHDAGALVHAVVVLGRHVEHALGADDFVRHGVGSREIAARVDAERAGGADIFEIARPQELGAHDADEADP